MNEKTPESNEIEKSPAQILRETGDTLRLISEAAKVEEINEEQKQKAD